MVGGLKLFLERTDFRPVVKVVRNVPPILDVHYFRYRALSFVPLEQQDECTAHAYHAQCCVMCIKQ